MFMNQVAAIDLVREMMISTGEEVEVRKYKRLTELIIEVTSFPIVFCASGYRGKYCTETIGNVLIRLSVLLPIRIRLSILIAIQGSIYWKIPPPPSGGGGGINTVWPDGEKIS
jgi:hypothetical protein